MHRRPTAAELEGEAPIRSTTPTLVRKPSKPDHQLNHEDLFDLSDDSHRVLPSREHQRIRQRMLQRRRRRKRKRRPPPCCAFLCCGPQIRASQMTTPSPIFARQRRRCRQGALFLLLLLLVVVIVNITLWRYPQHHMTVIATRQQPKTSTPTHRVHLVVVPPPHIPLIDLVQRLQRHPDERFTWIGAMAHFAESFAALEADAQQAVAQLVHTQRLDLASPLWSDPIHTRVALLSHEQFLANVAEGVQWMHHTLAYAPTAMHLAEAGHHTTATALRHMGFTSVVVEQVPNEEAFMQRHHGQFRWHATDASLQVQVVPAHNDSRMTAASLQQRIHKAAAAAMGEDLLLLLRLDAWADADTLQRTLASLHDDTLEFVHATTTSFFKTFPEDVDILAGSLPPVLAPLGTPTQPAGLQHLFRLVSATRLFASLLWPTLDTPHADTTDAQASMTRIWRDTLASLAGSGDVQHTRRAAKELMATMMEDALSIPLDKEALHDEWVHLDLATAEGDVSIVVVHPEGTMGTVRVRIQLTNIPESCFTMGADPHAPLGWRCSLRVVDSEGRPVIGQLVPDAHASGWSPCSPHATDEEGTDAEEHSTPRVAPAHVARMTWSLYFSARVPRIGAATFGILWSPTPQEAPGQVVLSRMEVASGLNPGHASVLRVRIADVCVLWPVTHVVDAVELRGETTTVRLRHGVLTAIDRRPVQQSFVVYRRGHTPSALSPDPGYHFAVGFSGMLAFLAFLGGVKALFTLVSGVRLPWLCKMRWPLCGPYPALHECALSLVLALVAAGGYLYGLRYGPQEWGGVAAGSCTAVVLFVLVALVHYARGVVSGVESGLVVVLTGVAVYAGAPVWHGDPIGSGSGASVSNILMMRGPVLEAALVSFARYPITQHVVVWHDASRVDVDVAARLHDATDMLWMRVRTRKRASLWTDDGVGGGRQTACTWRWGLASSVCVARHFAALVVEGSDAVVVTVPYAVGVVSPASGVMDVLQTREGPSRGVYGVSVVASMDVVAAHTAVYASPVAMVFRARTPRRGCCTVWEAPLPPQTYVLGAHPLRLAHGTVSMQFSHVSLPVHGQTMHVVDVVEVWLAAGGLGGVPTVWTSPMGLDVWSRPHAVQESRRVGMATVAFTPSAPFLCVATTCPAVEEDHRLVAWSMRREALDHSVRKNAHTAVSLFFLLVLVGVSSAAGYVWWLARPSGSRSLASLPE